MARFDKHTVDFEMSTVPQLFDRRQIARNLGRRQGNDADFVTRLVMDDLADRLATISRRFDRALILAPDANQMPESLSSADGPIRFQRVSTLVSTSGERPVDPEALELEHTNYDLIVSLFDMAIVNDVPGFLAAIHRHLQPDGLFMAAFVGGTSLNELRSAWLRADATHIGGAVARVAPFIDTRDAGGLLQRAGFALPVADIEPHIVRYASPLALMTEIKSVGASNPLLDRQAGWLARAHLLTAIDAYQELAGDPDGRVRATVELVWMSGWSPHESQQKALQPGSAQVSLTDVLSKKL